MRWAGHVARMGERKGVYRVSWGNLKERDHLGDTGVDVLIVLVLRCGHSTRIKMWS